jgi:hypothetical protein
MAQSAKLIKSTGVSKNDPKGQWYNLEDIIPFIQGIVTGELDENQISSTLITGVPTPWARAKIFSFAFQYVTSKDPNIQQSGLISFFKGLVNEWKGLLALVALYPDRVSFSEPIYMDPNSNLFDLAGAFGRMLLDDADIWTDQQKKQNNPNELSYIQLLRYKGQVIGGTSPFSIVFPGVEYAKLEHAPDVPWYRNGKFEDPMRYLANDKDKLQKLYLFINNIIGLTYTDKSGTQIARKGTIIDFKENINLSRRNNRLDLNGLEKVLSKWQIDIKQLESNLQINGTVAQYSNLGMPFKALLESKQRVYRLPNGDLTFELDGATQRWTNEMTQINPSATPLQIQGMVQQWVQKNTLSDLQNILQDGGSVVGWFEAIDYQQPLSNAAVYYLPVNDVSNRQNKYFSLPLTIEAIQMFGQKIDSFVTGNQRNMSIDASIKDNKLCIDLSVEIDGQPYKLNTKEYDIVWADDMKKFGGDGKIIMWPDFISDNWNAYYLYTEFPLHNVQGLKFVPFYKRGQDQKIITANVGTGSKVVYSNSAQNELLQANLEITELVTYPANLANMPQYEVIKSNCPIAGLEIRIENVSKSENAGYLIVRNPNTTFGNKQIKDLTTEPFVEDATVGIDFGSNNSCAYYTLSIDSKRAIPIKFKNHRLALVGTDSTKGLEAEQDELLFFSNEFSQNGQIKSWLHEHDNRYVLNNDDKEISGGVAVNEKNILVKEMTEYKITTQAGILHYNMKWLSNSEGISKKTAYLKALWLSICADLYSDHYKPIAIRWSYPGSMSSFDFLMYRNIYAQQLPALTPIFSGGQQTILNEISELTESEAVCRYALSQERSLDNNVMFIGIDIGGSTSDILLMANYKKNEHETIPRLYKQSSIRIAAGVFFKAVQNSSIFRKAIVKYHNSQNKIKITNIDEISSDGKKAPFYLNSLFDQLTDDTFGLFYSSIVKEASFVYAIPAYVTGLLVYYSAKLAAKTIKDNPSLNVINEVHLLPFGKGGRLFHWLKSRQSDILGSSEYYEDCFRAGFGEGSEMIRINYREEIAKDNKSEVAKGLSVSNQDFERQSKDDLKETRDKSDIFAEKKLRYFINGQYAVIDELETLDNKYFENIKNFEFPEKLENLEDFLHIFIDFVGTKAGLVKNYSALESRIPELKGLLKSFIENDTEYDKALRSKQPNAPIQYRIPILIAEGMCYLERILIPEVFKI